MLRAGVPYTGNRGRSAVFKLLHISKKDTFLLLQQMPGKETDHVLLELKRPRVAEFGVNGWLSGIETVLTTFYDWSGLGIVTNRLALLTPS